MKHLALSLLVVVLACGTLGARADPTLDATVHAAVQSALRRCFCV